MASETYSRFLGQLNATGRMRLDGFDMSHIRGMSDDEAIEAFQLVEDKLATDPDMTLVTALHMLDPDRALPILKKLANESSRASLTTFEASRILFEIYKENSQAEHLASALSKLSSLEKMVALASLKKSSFPDVVLLEMADIIRRDDDYVVRDQAAQHLLFSLRLKKNVTEQEALAFARASMSEDPSVRAEALQLLAVAT
jgi:hypothetical protein